MSNAQAKTINLLLYDGDLNGVISIEDTNWNAGELYAAPRDSVEDLLKTDACSKYGVYLLLSDEMVYVGQSFDLAKRITQHTVGKDWWDRVVILTTKDDSFDHTSIDYLESMLIDMAFEIERLDCENKKKGNPPKVDKYKKVSLKQYLDEALFVMQLIGVNVFYEKNHKHPALNVANRLAVGKRAKNDAVEYVKKQGFDLGKNISYAVRSETNDDFWINPKVALLEKEWFIILNNNIDMELIILHVPADSFKVSDSSGEGLHLRSDKKNLIQIKLDLKSLKDKVSGLSFTEYEKKRIKY